ncbi:OLC1v1035061C1 [Oldenlandia corymbosa var. corymbosa]|uniref:Pectinesterase n=1 Tax=Oldenlandia corymbosa var. corymbosa TaxID=529605 RepID=A0AAV1CVA8_OLDCO|nr:OLC1v1035061C1 [Oldenlandia corymbosa var. corymbosa]
MASLNKSLKFMLLMILCLGSVSPSVRSDNGTKNLVDQSNCLNVPIDHFVSSINSTIQKLWKVTFFVSKFNNTSRHDLQVSGSLSHCLELLNTSAEELGWTVEALLNYDTEIGTGDLSSDLRTWLSSVLVNLDSCEESFDHGNSTIETSLENELNKVASSVTQTIGMVDPKCHARDETCRPFWLEIRRRKLIWADKEPVNVVVALDGSGDFTSINDAVNSAPDRSPERFVVYVKKGVYKEYVKINKDKWNIVMIGDGMDASIISGNRSTVDGRRSYDTATFCVKGRGFVAKYITFENKAGPERHQAVAFLCDADVSALYRCGFKGYQDTLYPHKYRQFYKECVITGTVDFIFGRASAVFQDCQIIARKGLPKQKNAITAQGRKHLSEFSGFSLQSCSITVSPEVVADSVETYLGRPWKEYSTTVIMQSNISSAISPQGWLPWAGNFALDTLYYGEYMNRGS